MNISKQVKKDLKDIAREATSSFKMYFEDVRASMNTVVQIRNKSKRTEYIIIDRLPKHTILCECHKCQPSFRRWAREGLK